MNLKKNLIETELSGGYHGLSGKDQVGRRWSKDTNFQL